MRNLLRWLACANWAVLLYVAILLFVESCYWIDRHYTGRSMNGFAGVRDAVLVAGVLVYGAWRVRDWHPVYHDEYRGWLLMTPWNGAAPLPLGPVHWTWRDPAVVGGLFAMGNLHPRVSPIYLPLLAIVAYLATLLLTFLPARLWGHFYGLIFGLGLIVSFWLRPYIALAFGLALYGFAYWGLRRSLAQLPRDQTALDKESWRAFGDASVIERDKHWLGWPHDSLAPAPADRAFNVSWIHGLLLSLAAGWLFRVALSLCAFYAADDSHRQATTLFDDLRQGAQLDDAATERLRTNAQRVELALASDRIRAIASVVLLFAGLFAAAWRVTSYRVGYAPPINFWGRLFTGRWIVPGYDRIFVAPLAILAIIAFGTMSIASGWLAPGICGPIALASIWLIALNMGPGQLTLHCACPARLVPHAKSRDKLKFVRI